MKTFFASLIILVMAALSTTPAAQAAPAPDLTDQVTTLVGLIPSSIVVEQTSALSDGRTVTVYYKKSGDLCEVYTADNLNGYTVNDLAKLKSSNFRVVSGVKGKRVYSTTTAKAAKLLSTVLAQCL